MTVQNDEAMDLLRRGFHSVAFQPICELESARVFGYEALMRGPDGTALADPARVFRGVAEEPALLHEVDAACLVAAIRLGRFFTERHALFVNIHGETLMRRQKTAEEIADVVLMLNVPFGSLVLEISETTGHAHVRAIRRSLAALRAAGVRIALDDIGARYAWLHHVLRLEPDFLKIDRQFVRGVSTSQRHRDVIRGIVALGADIGARVIVEGIETADERQALIDTGVKLGQGYLLGRPSPVQQWLPRESSSQARTQVPALLERQS